MYGLESYEMGVKIKSSEFQSFFLHLILFVSSPEKYRIYQRACKAPEAQKLPLAEVLRKTRASVSVFIVEG